MYGADVEELRALAQKFERAATELTSVTHELTGSVAKARAWTGPGASRFRSHWQVSGGPRLRATASALSAAGASLRSNADQQESASAAAGGGSTTYAPYPVPTSIAVHKSVSSPDVAARGAYSPDEVISDIGAAEKKSSSVEIRKIVQPDGDVSYIVYVPGVQLGKPKSDPFDMAAAEAAYTGSSTNVTRLVEEAMRQAGIGPNDPVMLAGHSLGGLTVGNLAADPDFRSHYDVQAVLSVGANISTDSIPKDIAVTQVNNTAGDPISLATGAAFSALDPLPQEAQNLTQINFSSIDIQNSRLVPVAEDIAEIEAAPFLPPQVTRNALVNLFGHAFDDHSNFTEYAGRALAWSREGDNLSKWQSSTAAFQATKGTSSSLMTYVGGLTP